MFDEMSLHLIAIFINFFMPAHRKIIYRFCMNTHLLYHKRLQPQLNLEYMMELTIENVLDQLYPIVVIEQFDLLSTLFLKENRCLSLPEINVENV